MPLCRIICGNLVLSDTGSALGNKGLVFGVQFSFDGLNELLLIKKIGIIHLTIVV